VRQLQGAGRALQHRLSDNVAREPFEIDPALAVEEEGAFQELSERFGRKFFPAGEMGRGEFLLAIDEDGVLYLLAAWAFRLGPSDEALENLINGAQAVPFPKPTRFGPDKPPVSENETDLLGLSRWLSVLPVGACR
jgi:hypothetical protein